MDKLSLPPLPEILRDAVEESLGKGKTLSSVANPGLVFERYPRLWKHDRIGWSVDEGRRDFLIEFAREYAESKRSCELLLKARLESLKTFGRPFGPGRDFVAQWRFVTGMGGDHPLENGFAFHRLFGVPYLPGSGVKGLVRRTARICGIEENEEKRLFGPSIERAEQGQEEEGAGALIFLDALPVEWPSLGIDIVNNHHPLWTSFVDGDRRRGLGDLERASAAGMDDPNPVFFLAVEDGLRFRFWVSARPGAEASEQDIDDAYDWLAIGLEYLGAGAKTAVGYGRFIPYGKQSMQQREEPPISPPPSPRPKLAKGDRVWFVLANRSKRGKWQGHLRDYPDSFGTLLGEPPPDAEEGNEYEVIVGAAGDLTNLNLRWP